MSAADLSNPILNSPYAAPEQHFELGQHGPTGVVLPGRRPSESFIPIPTSKKKRGKGADAAEQVTFDFDTTGERREDNSLINDVRQRVELWRNRGYPWVTPMSRMLLEHWAGGPGPAGGPDAVLPAGGGRDGHLPGRGQTLYTDSGWSPAVLIVRGAAFRAPTSAQERGGHRSTARGEAWFLTIGRQQGRSSVRFSERPSYEGDAARRADVPGSGL